MNEFLAGMTSQAGGQNFAQTLLNTGIGLATGQYKSRPSWRDLQFMDDVSTRLLPSQMKREQDYLAGMTPHQASAYNTYQDATYGEDTRRNIEGIKSMATELGMSPWELSGQSGSAAPMPTPDFGGQGGAAKGQQLDTYLSATVPVQVAKLQSQTAIQTALINSATQRAIAGQATAEGAEPIARTKLLHVQRDLAKLEEGIKVGMTEQIRVQTMTEVIRTMANLMPKTELNFFGLLKSSGIDGAQQLAQIIGADNKFTDDATNEAVQNFVRNMSDGDFDKLRELLSTMVDKGARTIESIGENIGNFFSGKPASNMPYLELLK